MSDSEFLRFDHDLSIARITLTRPARRNALTRSMIVQIEEEVSRLVECHRDSPASVRLLTIAAEGPVFCAGMDLGEMEARARDDSGPAEWLQDSLVYCELIKSILLAPFPVLAVMQGPVLAGGVGVVLACDLVIASETAFLSLPEPQRGITAAMVTPLLTARVGMGHAGNLLLSGQRIAAANLVSCGIIHHVCPEGELGPAELEWTDRILSGSPVALAQTKQYIREFASPLLESQLNEAARYSALARETPDAREGLQAFLEKRKPSWQERRI